MPANLSRTLLGLVLILCLCAGCKEPLRTEYGDPSARGTQSVNGTSVFAELMRRAGHKVSSTYRLTPRVRKRAGVIVWAPDDFGPPKDDVRRWFEHWLDDNYGHTLIYVGRDYDAAITYWSTVLPTLDPKSEEAREMRIDLASARAKQAVKRQDAITKQKGRVERFDDYEPWFTLDHTAKSQRVTQVDGEERWTGGFDVNKAELELNTQLDPDFDAEVLLETAAGEPLVTTMPWNSGKLILVANGSFLLNMPLVNHEHRKLGGQLIDELGNSPREVVFLASDESGPTVSDTDEAMRSGLEILTIPPFNLILLHLSIVGIIFAFARWPIFGVARPWNDEHVGDFGRHVAALGRLLRLTRNQGYAHERIRQYQQLPKGDGGSGRKGSPKR